MKGRVLPTAVASILFWLLVSCTGISADGTATPAPTTLPHFIWDVNPDVRMMLATHCCASPTTEELVRFYIPEAQLWGDGRLLWTEQDEEGTRQVFVAWLTADEMQALLQQIASAGFFAWKEEYTGEPVVDGISKCLTVTLVDQVETVCETHGGAPSAFYTLFDHLSQGAGYNGTLFHPDRAFVTGFGPAELAAPQLAAALTWEETQASFPVSHVLSGIWLEDGRTLQLLWDAANRDPYRMPLVEDGDQLYRLILQVPGVSWIEP
jgi:hypothetical protein